MTIQTQKRIRKSLISSAIMVALGGCANMDASFLKDSDRVTAAEKEFKAFSELSVNSELSLDLADMPEDALIPRPIKNQKTDLPNIFIPPIDVSETGAFSAIRDILRKNGLSLVIKGDIGGSRNYGGSAIYGLSGSLPDVMSELADAIGFFYYVRGNMVVVEFEQQFIVSLPPILGEDSIAGLVNTIQYLGAKETYTDRSNRTLVFSANRKTYNQIADFLDKKRKDHSIIAYEVQIYQVDLNNDSNKGINWNKLGWNRQVGTAANAVLGSSNILGGAATGTGTTATTSTATTGTTSTTTTTAAANAVATAAAMATRTASGMGLVLAGSRLSADVLIEFLETQGKVKTLSSPKINVMNNAKANIRVGGRVSYVAKVGTNFSTSINQSTMETAVLATGIQVSLVGSISEGTVYTTVGLSVADVARFDDVSVLGLSARLPQTVDRELETIVRTRPGDTVLLGGMTVDRVSEEVNSGLSINSKASSIVRSELVIALTPRIIRFAKTQKQEREPEVIEAKAIKPALLDAPQNEEKTVPAPSPKGAKKSFPSLGNISYEEVKKAVPSISYALPPKPLAENHAQKQKEQKGAPAPVVEEETIQAQKRPSPTELKAMRKEKRDQARRERMSNKATATTSLPAESLKQEEASFRPLNLSLNNQAPPIYFGDEQSVFGSLKPLAGRNNHFGN